MSKKRNKIIKRRIKKSRLIIVILLLFVSIFSLAYATKNIVTYISSSAISREKEDKDIKEKEEEKSKEIEQLTLESEDTGKKFKVMIDPGHGGDDIGRQGFSKETVEKDIALNISKKVASRLSQYNDIEVVFTRSEDITLSVEDRVNIANSQKPDILVSIHLNGEYGGNTASGTETYYQKESVDNSDKLAKSIQDTLCLYLETRNRGVLATNIELLRGSIMPSVSVEAGFLTNKEEEKKLNSDSYQDKMADGISQGILSYIDSTK